MQEFGSDFHYTATTDFSRRSENTCSEYLLYANGRHAIQHLIAYKQWERIWLPEYFCYEVFEAIKSTGIKLQFYPDAPGGNDSAIIEKLIFGKKDVLFRMNYFGLRTLRDNSSIIVEVIEDHSHDFSGNWASNSNADWCIASLRKTLPIPEGGVLWSPKQHKIPEQPGQTAENKQLVEKRWLAMKLKQEYLFLNSGNKNSFRELFIETENGFEKLLLSGIAQDCIEYLTKFDNNHWNRQKNQNWKILAQIKSECFQIMLPESNECNVFSFVFTLKSEQEREIV